MFNGHQWDHFSQGAKSFLRVWYQSAISDPCLQFCLVRSSALIRHSIFSNSIVQHFSLVALITTLPSSCIVSIPISKSYSRGLSRTTSVSNIAQSHPSVRIEIIPTLQPTWDIPSIFSTVICHLFQVPQWLALIIEWEHPIPMRAIHCTLFTCTLAAGKPAFTDWQGTRVVTIPCPTTHFQDNSALGGPDCYSSSNGGTTTLVVLGALMGPGDTKITSSTPIWFGWHLLCPCSCCYVLRLF